MAGNLSPGGPPGPYWPRVHGHGHLFTVFWFKNVDARTTDFSARYLFDKRSQCGPVKCFVGREAIVEDTGKHRSRRDGRQGQHGAPNIPKWPQRAEWEERKYIPVRPNSTKSIVLGLAVAPYIYKNMYKASVLYGGESALLLSQP